MDRTQQTRVRSAVAIAVGFMALYFLLAWNRIDGQGLYYDELHQAPAAFSFIGRHQTLLSIGFHSFPLLNTTYGGALKSALYGGYLRATGNRFSLKSWRALGIGIVMIGIMAFSLWARRGLSATQMAVFLTFLCSDPTVILATRHDWGPAALALSLRLFFIGIVLRSRWSAKVSLLSTGLLGAVAGISIFEKLSSVVMLAPLALVMIVDSRRHARRHYTALCAGFAAGLFPLALVNIGSFVKHGVFVSLTSFAGPVTLAKPPLLSLLWDMLAQSGGKLIEQFILGTASPLPQWPEGTLLLLVVLTVLAHGLYQWRKNGAVPESSVMALSYVALAAGIAALPRATWVHHWIILTPFQYAAIALWCPYACKGRSGRRGSALVSSIPRMGWLSAVVLLFGMHLFSTYTAEKALAAGKASLKWDRSLTELADFAIKNASNTGFIAAGWGVGIQICCMSNGQRDLVYEPFWNYRGKQDLDSIVRNSKKSVFYVISLAPACVDADSIEAQIRRDADSVNLLRPTPLDNRSEEFKAVRIKKYERTRARLLQHGG